MTIAEAVELARSGREAGYRYLYETTYKSKYYLALQYMKNEESAKDVLQEAYIKAAGGVLASASETELVTPELSLKDSYGGYAFDTRDFGEYVITTAQKEP